MNIALIRGINVGGHKKVAMADLRKLLESMGLAGVKSLLQSGNLVFSGGDRRTSAAWERVLETEAAKRLELEADPGHLALQAAILGRELARADGRHLYLVFPNGIGTSRLTTALIEKKLGTRGTGRNWNTVLKLHGLTSSG